MTIQKALVARGFSYSNRPVRFENKQEAPKVEACKEVKMELAAAPVPDQMSPDEVVVGYIDGTLQVPEAVQPLVEVYRKHAKDVGKLVSYPRQIGDLMDAIYDSLVILAERKVI